MDTVIARIKGYVLVLFPDILEDVGITDALLDFMVNDIVNRALTYMNRYQLVDGYTEFLLGNYYDSNVTYDLSGDRQPILPIPLEIERAIAKAVVSASRGVVDARTSNGSITKIDDQGQSISYGENLTSFFNSSSDAEVFSGMTVLLDKFRIPTIVDNS